MRHVGWGDRAGGPVDNIVEPLIYVTKTHLKLHKTALEDKN